jgi:hypothetical protein
MLNDNLIRFNLVASCCHRKWSQEFGAYAGGSETEWRDASIRLGAIALLVGRVMLLFCRRLFLLGHGRAVACLDEHVVSISAWLGVSRRESVHCRQRY